MNARRIPFQFSTTDPLARQRELEKRFGLQPSCPKMYVDVNSPLSMGTTTPKETSSPRLQHRVPIFAEGYDQPIHSSSVDSMASVHDIKKPNVRVIPIEVEGADNRSQRHRTYSGPSNTLKDRCDSAASDKNGAFPFKRLNFENLPKTSKLKPNAEPRVYNIPIKVEGADNISSHPRYDIASKPANKIPSANGCSLSKSPSKANSSKEDDRVKSEPDQSQNIAILLKKIEDILTEFKTYESGVLEFNGTSKDKQYRYLDEMLTRCMLRLDDIDTMGNEEIRLARKNAVKKIQNSIDLLESKANVESETSVDVPQVLVTPGESSAVDKNDNSDIEMEDNEVKDNTVGSTSSEIKEMDISIDNSKEDPSKTSDGILSNDVKTEGEGDSKVESTEITISPQDKISDITEIEMDGNEISSSENNSLCGIQKHDICLEGRSESSEIADKVVDDHVMQGDDSLSLQQQNNIPEIEMSEKISLEEVNSANDTPSSEMLRSDSKSALQHEVFDKVVINDDVMLDEKDSTSTAIEESLSLNETAEKKIDLNESNEVPEVEMVEIKDIPS